VTRDASALLSEDVLWGDVEQAILALGISEIVSVTLFDTYRGEGMPEGFRSLAFRVTYRSEGRTLTDDEVAALHGRVTGLLESRFGAQLR